jgi:hypothetical protein
LLLLLLL